MYSNFYFNSNFFINTICLHRIQTRVLVFKSLSSSHCGTAICTGMLCLQPCHRHVILWASDRHVIPAGMFHVLKTVVSMCSALSSEMK